MTVKELREMLVRPGYPDFPPEDYEVVAQVSEEYGDSRRSFRAQIELDNNHRQIVLVE